MTIYNPQRFAKNDLDASFELMDRNLFATVVSVANKSPYISHLPLTPKRVGDTIELVGHLARANPHSKILSKDQDVTAVFHGPHAYITPKWYAENNVPTWNYAVVHAKGKVQLVEDYESILGCLQELARHAERHWPSGWEFFVPDDLKDPMLTKKIVGFKITIEDIQYKNKMSQNNPAEDIKGVLRGLAMRGDDNSLGVRAEMLKVFPDLKDVT